MGDPAKRDVEFEDEKVQEVGEGGEEEDAKVA